jgi:methylated-DNA-[protein]-cysteine S-methyltransferase
MIIPTLLVQGFGGHGVLAFLNRNFSTVTSAGQKLHHKSRESSRLRVHNGRRARLCGRTTSDGMNRSYYTWFESPVGPLLLAGSESALRLVSFAAGKRARTVDPAWQEDASMFADAMEQLQSYFAGNRKNFELPLDLEGTEFQKKVWTALRSIPYGETVSYKELAGRVGSPKAVRAVGAANGANPIPIIIPCHRVIGNDGSLTGFGGGLALKKKLLQLENRQLTLL